jgi:hemerythrin-like metal-binding protein
MRIFWQDTMCLGLAAVDDEHQHMVSLLDGVCLALMRRDLSAAAAVLAEFSQVLNSHFATEEVMLDQMLAEASQQHREVHRHIGQVVKRLAGAVGDDRNLAEAEALAAELVTHWISRLFREDTEMISHMKRRPRAEAALPV